MKLFVWKNVLTDYSDGVIFALAKDKENAEAVVLNNFIVDSWQYKSLKQTFLDNLPDVYETSFGFALWGGG